MCQTRIESANRLSARVFVYVLTPTFLVSVGTWVTFGGQITDEVRADGFCHLPSVKAYKWIPPYERGYPGVTKMLIFNKKTISTESEKCSN